MKNPMLILEQHPEFYIGEDLSDLFLYPEEECHHPHVCIDPVYGHIT
jgi:hypothetical protein